MASSEGRGVDICKAITSFISWLASLLAYFSKRSQPLEELPIVMSGSHQTIALLDAFHSEAQASACQPAGRKHHSSEGEIDATGMRSERRRFRSATSRINRHLDSLGSPPLYPALREMPLSIYPPTFRWTSPISVPEDDDKEVEGHPPSASSKVHAGIGELGMRRGFKGKPLIFSRASDTGSSWSRSSLLHSLPKGMPFSPRSASMVSLDGPRTPLEAVASRMRSVSVSVVSWSAGLKSPVPTVNDIPQDLQELYDELDPFSYPGESFFPSSVDDTAPASSNADLTHLNLYRECGLTRKPSYLSKKSTSNHPRLDLAFTNARMKTSIYDLSTADIVPVRVATSVARTVARVSGRDERDTVDVVLAATSPAIILTAPPTPTTGFEEPAHEAARMGNLQGVEKGLAKETYPHAVQKASRTALVNVSNTLENDHGENGLVIGSTPVFNSTKISDNFEPHIFEYAKFPDVTYHTHLPTTNAPSSSPFLRDIDWKPRPIGPEIERKNTLRPLVLPAQVAKRLSERTNMVHLDKNLEGIIALLDKELVKSD